MADVENQNEDWGEEAQQMEEADDFNFQTESEEVNILSF